MTKPASELKRLKYEIVGSLSKVQVYDVTAAGERVIEAEADKILAKIQSYIQKRIKAAIPEFTLIEIDQLEVYCRWAEQEGTYYGRHDQFKNRHQVIKSKLEIIKRAKGEA